MVREYPPPLGWVTRRPNRGPTAPQRRCDSAMLFFRKIALALRRTGRRTVWHGPTEGSHAAILQPTCEQLQIIQILVFLSHYNYYRAEIGSQVRLALNGSYSFTGECAYELHVSVESHVQLQLDKRAYRAVKERQNLENAPCQSCSRWWNIDTFIPWTF